MSFDVFVLLLTHTVTELKFKVFEPLTAMFLFICAIPDSEVNSLVQSTAISFKSPPPLLLFFCYFFVICDRVFLC